MVQIKIVSQTKPGGEEKKLSETTIFRPSPTIYFTFFSPSAATICGNNNPCSGSADRGRCQDSRCTVMMWSAQPSLEKRWLHAKEAPFGLRRSCESQTFTSLYFTKCQHVVCHLIIWIFHSQSGRHRLRYLQPGADVLANLAGPDKKLSNVWTLVFLTQDFGPKANKSWVKNSPKPLETTFSKA